MNKYEWLDEEYEEKAVGRKGKTATKFKEEKGAPVNHRNTTHKWAEAQVNRYRKAAPL
jgi:hypothetical protein